MQRAAGAFGLRSIPWLIAAACAVSSSASGADSDAIFASNFDDIFVTSPYLGSAPAAAHLVFSSRLDAVDAYVIVDRSGSMANEDNSIKSNLSTVIAQLACPPEGGTDCVADLWAGAGALGYAMSGADAYRNFVDLQPNPSFAGLTITEPSGCCAEPLSFSVYAAVTGNGGTDYGFTGVPARASCATSPAANAGFATFGYPCFRQGALPLILLATDEPPLSAGDTNKSPDWTTIVLPEMLVRGARFIGILGSGFVAGTDTDLRKMATDTAAVDLINAAAPLVFDGANSNATNAIKAAILAAVKGVPLRVRAVVEDDPDDTVDAVAAFVDHVETLQLGTAECAAGLSEEDSGSDGYADRYTGVIPGTGVCWKIVPTANVTVASSAVRQTFHIVVRVTAEVDVALGSRDIYFVVPASGS